MKLTLRKASALQNSIQEAIKNIDIKTNILINEFQDSTTVLSAANAEVVKNDARRDALTKVLYTIRAQVGNANTAAGVADKLSEAAYIDKRIGHLQALVGAEVQADAAVIAGKLDKLRNRQDATAHYYGREEGVQTGVLTAAQVEQFKATQRDLKKRKQKLNDEVLELNVRTEIEVADADVAVLTAEGVL